MNSLNNVDETDREYVLAPMMMMIIIIIIIYNNNMQIYNAHNVKHA